MKFGEIELAEAEGAVLAHTHRLPGAVFKKGRVLSALDVEVLRSAGRTRIIAARLEPDDVLEDEAAREVADRIAGEGVSRAEPGTGRANLFAKTRGLLAFDADRVHRLNRVDPAITIATLPAYALVEAADMVATVKIIPFAAPRRSLDQVARLEPGWLRVAPFVAHRVALVQTRIPEMHDLQLDRSLESQRVRVEHLGSTLFGEVRCPHTESAIAQAFRELLDRGAELVLALGASATCDPRDVIPAAIERVGGSVDYVGMPVDPGNLLLLGRAQGATFIGVPGCARSLKRSGFDAVLERVLAKIPPTGDDLARMGAGGLLSEIEQRPAPRAGKIRASPRFAAIVLAAGMSRRMGSTNKLVEEAGGEPIVARAVDALLASRVRRIFVVTGHERERIQDALRGRQVRFVHNPSFAQGMSTSLRTGIHALDDTFDAVVIALGDMPLVEPAHIDKLLETFDPHGPHTICVPTFAGQRGHPVLLAARHFPEVSALSGDVGARSILERHRDRVLEVPIEDEGIRIDVDTPEALEALKGVAWDRSG
jgi:molybdenum cofactor cytidylyltransferase